MRRMGGWADGRTVVALLVALLGFMPRSVFGCEHAQQPSALAPTRPSATPDTANHLAYPGVVQERSRTTARDDALLVQALERRIHCTCGCGLDVFTCRTTDFTCTTSPAMHRVVLARLDSAMTADQVVDAFERQYGTSILMQPPKKGFNLAAYVVPFVVLGAGMTLLAWFMRRWVTRPAGAAAEVPVTAPAPPSADVERLQRELEKFEA
jgi:cytochrome c-type biogenesis protein CcmH/NrfF